MLSIFMMALGIIYPIGLIVEGVVGQKIGVPKLTVLTGVALFVIFGLLALVRPQIFRSLRAPDPAITLDLATPEVAEVDLAGGLSHSEERDGEYGERR